MTWAADPVEEDVGIIQIIVTDGSGVNHDITSYNGVPVMIESVVSNEPFGDASATLDFKTVTPYMAPQRLWGQFPNLDIYIVKPDASKDIVFQGFIADWDFTLEEDDWTAQAQCKGALYQLDFDIIPPPIYLPAGPIDVGVLIKQQLDSHHTRLNVMDPTTTGIQTLKAAGGGQPLLTGYIQDLLSIAMSADGGQWTLMLADVFGGGRQPVLRLKDRTTIHWTMACGAPGTTHQMSLDSTTGVTTLYGEGIDPFGCYWRNTKYPNLHADTSPIFTSPISLTIGVTDAQSNGDVSIWQRAMHDAGFSGVTVTGTFNAADRTATLTLQQNSGIQVDGLVGAQTWATTFQAGSNQGSLTGAYFAPLYSDPRVEPSLHNPDGSVSGPNPNYNPEIVRVETWTNYGTGVSKDLATQMAKIQYNRDHNPAWMGTITLASDPDEGSRFTIRPGQNILYEGFAGNVSSELGAATVTTDQVQAGRALNEPIVGAVSNTAGGFWAVAGDGGVFAFDGATFQGSLAGTQLAAPIVGMASTPFGGGYWLVAADGGVFAESNGNAFGNATFSGSLPSQNIVPNKRVVGIATGPDNGSYWVASADGGVYSFGSATFYGSLPSQGITPNAPVVGIISTFDHQGYYLVAADGGVFAFGDATYFGDPVGTALAAPITGIALAPLGSGYYLVASDGGVFSFGAVFYGSLGGATPVEQIVAVVPSPDGLNYTLVGADSATFRFTNTGTVTPVTTSTSGGILFHVSQVEKNFQDLTVTLTVDEKARDLMTLDSVYQRNRQANDPALRPMPFHMNSVQTFDNIPVFDCESGGGIIPYMAIQTGLWTVIHIPVSATGTIAEMTLTADDTSTLLSMGVFDQALTAADLVQYGNPLSDPNFWQKLGTNHGLIIGWGSADQPGGFSPGSLTDGGPPTGKIIDNAAWYYTTTSSPWLWVAVFGVPLSGAGSTFVQGRLLPITGT